MGAAVLDGLRHLHDLLPGLHGTGTCHDGDAAVAHLDPHAEIHRSGLGLGLAGCELVRAQDADDLLHTRLGLEAGEALLAPLVADGAEQGPFSPHTLVDPVPEGRDERLDVFDLFRGCTLFHGNDHTGLLCSQFPEPCRSLIQGLQKERPWEVTTHGLYVRVRTDQPTGGHAP